MAGGVRVLELTLRTPVALAAVEAIANEVEGAIVGVGTITRAQDFDAAIKAGALFGVSPGLTPELIAAANDSGLPLLPGVMTPSDVIAAALGGVPAAQAVPGAAGRRRRHAEGARRAVSRMSLSALPAASAQATAAEFLALPNVACVGGSWLTPADAIAAGDWDRITTLARATLGLRRPAR